MRQALYRYATTASNETELKEAGKYSNENSKKKVFYQFPANIFFNVRGDSRSSGRIGGSGSSGQQGSSSISAFVGFQVLKSRSKVNLEWKAQVWV